MMYVYIAKVQNLYKIDLHLFSYSLFQDLKFYERLLFVLILSAMAKSSVK